MGENANASDQLPVTASPPTNPKFEVKDGVMLVDGKKVVHESDLIAAKKSLEHQIESAQAVHNAAIDKAKLDLSEAQTSLAAANARTIELVAAQKNAVAVTPADTAKQAKELKDAQDKAADNAKSVLDLRVKNIMLAYPGQVTEEQLKGKTPDQLAAFEEALKAVASGRGPGPYAILANAGGGAGPLSDMDRARAVLAATPVRGVREPVK